MSRLLCLFLLLAACGADGAPEPPAPANPPPGLHMSGDARVGIVLR